MGNLFTFNLNSWWICLKVRGGYFFRSKTWKKHRKQKATLLKISNRCLGWAGFRVVSKKGFMSPSFTWMPFFLTQFPRKPRWLPSVSCLKGRHLESGDKKPYSRPLFMLLSTTLSKKSKHVLKSHQSQCLYLWFRGRISTDVYSKWSPAWVLACEKLESRTVLLWYCPQMRQTHSSVSYSALETCVIV